MADACHSGVMTTPQQPLPPARPSWWSTTMGQLVTAALILAGLGIASLCVYGYWAVRLA